MARDMWKTIIGIGEVIVGGAIVLRGWQKVAGGEEPKASLLGGGRRKGLADAPKIQSTIRTVRNIDERLAYILEQIKKSSLDPETREDAAKVLSQKCQGSRGVKWCTPERDYLAEVRALFDAMRDPGSPLAVRYTRDHSEVDQFQQRKVTKRLKISDCDDQCIALGAMLMTVGYPIRLRVVQTKDSDSWNHIYLLVGLPPDEPTRWMPLDLTVRQPPGWQVRGADQVQLSGRASGDVTKVKDFEVSLYK